ncbi:MAG: metal-dependent hydrolase [Opitutaceae bacterium]|nr:metal-dependent hydrolase [Cytophagales bacterium]
MDSLTQIVLGAAIAELVLGKKVGNKAPLWGAICGTIPDLDILLNPFLSDLQELGSHRGFSHSICFSVLLAPLLGFLISVFYKKKEANWKEWALLCFLSLVTHPLLDAFTNYGTQLFLPFSNYRVALNSIFIVDPCYTVPMMIFLIIAMFINRKKELRNNFNKAGLIIAHFYLLFTLFNKLYMGMIFESALKKKSYSFDRYYTCPLPLQTALWTCLAEDEKGFYVGYYSWFDKSKDVAFRYILKNDIGLEEFKKTFPLKRLAWFTNGYHIFTRKNGELYLNDLRFGKTGGSFNSPGDFIYSWKISQNDGSTEISKIEPPFKWDSKVLEELKLRIKGIKKDSL